MVRAVLVTSFQFVCKIEIRFFLNNNRLECHFAADNMHSLSNFFERNVWKTQDKSQAVEKRSSSNGQATNFLIINCSSIVNQKTSAQCKPIECQASFCLRSSINEFVGRMRPLHSAVNKRAHQQGNTWLGAVVCLWSTVPSDELKKLNRIQMCVLCAVSAYRECWAAGSVCISVFVAYPFWLLFQTESKSNLTD